MNDLMVNPMQVGRLAPFLKNTVHSACLRRGVLLSVLVFSALSPFAGAVSPPPDGGYSSQNTAEGQDALLKLQFPFAPNNTALGYHAVYSTTTGNSNTATGAFALLFNITSANNTATGEDALYHTTGASNTATGHAALFTNTSGTTNTAIGRWALLKNTTAGDNTATGYSALRGNVTGTSNTANGANALYEDAIFEDHTGSRNVANGSAALYSNSIGIDNTATGVNALYFNKADYNTATGYQALESNTTGNNNTAHGLDSLNANTTGNDNTANGVYALFNNTDGSSNTAEGALALYQNTSGFSNTALGNNALYANTTGTQNIALGRNAGFNLTTGSDNIDIGNLGVEAESGTIRIGTAGTQTTTFIAGIKGIPITGGRVTVSSTGQLGVKPSSARFKAKIKPMQKASEAIFGLEPVTFQYKRELDQEGIPEFGLVAEQVEGVAPELVARDEEGKPYTVRYEAVNAMLLNEFIKRHRKGQEQERKIENLEATVAQLESLLSRRGAEIQRITDELAVTESAAAAAENP